MSVVNSLQMMNKLFCSAKAVEYIIDECKARKLPVPDIVFSMNGHVPEYSFNWNDTFIEIAFAPSEAFCAVIRYQKAGSNRYESIFRIDRVTLDSLGVNQTVNEMLAALASSLNEIESITLPQKCPACGDTARVINNASHYVRCQSCMLTGPVKETISSAILAWNSIRFEGDSNG